MKEKLLALLIAKFSGVSEATLERIATKKAGSVTEESELQSIVDGIDYGQILQSEVDAKITDANKKAVENYEKRHNLKDGKVIEKPEDTPPTPPVDDEAPEWFKKYATAQDKKLETLSESVSGVVGSQAKAQTLDNVKAKLKEKGLSEKHIDNWASKVNLEAEDLDAEIESHVNTYNEMKQDFIDSEVENGNFTPSGGGPSEDETVSQINDWGKQFDNK
jgi:hypothetical protein